MLAGLHANLHPLADRGLQQALFCAIKQEMTARWQVVAGVQGLRGAAAGAMRCSQPVQGMQHGHRQLWVPALSIKSRAQCNR